jgi:hypothetical protein
MTYKSVLASLVYVQFYQNQLETLHFTRFNLWTGLYLFNHGDKAANSDYPH